MSTTGGVEGDVASKDRAANFKIIFSRKNWAAWLAFGTCLLLTILVSYGLRQQAGASDHRQFNLHVREIIGKIQSRLGQHEQILLGCAGLFESSNEVNRDEWRTYVTRLKLSENYPGILGVGFSKLIRPGELEGHIAAIRAQGFPGYEVYPPGQRTLYTPVVFIEPFAGRNLAAFGYDMLSEPARSRAMLRAAEGAVTAISGKVKLVQENQGKVQAGFLMYVPVYRKGLPLTTSGERMHALQGFVYSPYRIDDLMQGILGGDAMSVEFAIFDGDTESDAALMFDSGLALAADVRKLGRFSVLQTISANGHHWTIRVTSRPEDGEKWGASFSLAVLTLGSGISLLVFLLVSSLIFQRERAQRLANTMTDQVRHNEKKLRASEERFDLALRGSNDGVWDWNIETGEVYHSARYQALMGMKEVPQIARFDCFAQQLHPDDRGPTLAQMKAHRYADTPFQINLRLQVDSGEWRWFSLRGIGIRNASGRPIRMVGSLSDISERRAAELRLRETLRFQAAMLDNAAHAVIACTPDGLITVFNRAAERLLGYQASEMTGKQTPAIFHDGDEVAERARLLSLELNQTIDPGFEVFVAKARLGMPIEHEWTYLRKDGSRCPVSLSITAILDESGVIDGFLGMAIDISARKLAEQALQDSVRHTQAILDNAADGIITIDQFGTVDSFNRAAERIFGFAAGEVLGSNVKMLMPEPYHGAHDGYLQNYHVTGAPRIIGKGREVEGRRKDGGTFPMDLAVTRSIHQGHPLYIGLVRDITERKRNDQLKAEFVSTVSHELRTPLTSISGALGLISGGVLGELPAKMRGMVEIAYKNSLRLSHLINDLLDMDKLVAGKISFDFQILLLMPLVEQAIESTRAFGAKFNVSFVIGAGDADVKVRIDGHRLHQVLANLLSNAAKFSPPGGRVSVNFARHDGLVRVEVIDCGSGIPDEFRARIFQKFSQADSSDTREKGGTGLGLAISKDLIERMNGSIGFTSEAGQGSCFFFDLPVWSALAVPADAKAPPESGAARILAVHGEPRIATLLAAALCQAGYLVDLANDCETARALLAQTVYAAITLDLMLPDRRCLALVQELRGDIKTVNLPVIIASAHAGGGKLAIGGEFNAVDWLDKPFDEVRLVAAVRRAAEKTAASKDGARPRVLHVENEPDLARIVVTMAQNDIDFDVAQSLSEARQLLAQNIYQVMVLDLDLPDGNSLELPPLFRAMRSPPSVVILSGPDLSESRRLRGHAALPESAMTPDNFLALLGQVVDQSQIHAAS